MVGQRKAMQGCGSILESVIGAGVRVSKEAFDGEWCYRRYIGHVQY